MEQKMVVGKGCKGWRSLETLFVKNKDGGEGGGGLLTFIL